MPEGNGEAELNEYQVFKQIIDGEFGSETILIDQFDMDREVLFAQLDATAELIFHKTETGELPTIDYDIHKQNFKNVVDQILDREGDADANLETVINLIKVDRDYRFTRMNEIMDDKLFEPVPRINLSNTVMRLVSHEGTYQQVLERLSSYYKNELDADVRSFIKNAYSVYSDENDSEITEADKAESKFLLGKKELKEHVTDVAKIAAGVTIALIADRLLKGKD